MAQSWVGAAALGAVFTGVMIGVIAALWPRSRKRERISQIAHYGPGRGGRAAVSEPPSAGNVLVRMALAATASVLTGGLERRLAARLERAGMRLRPQEWVLLRLCVTVTIAALLLVFLQLAGAILGALLGWLTTGLYQHLKIENRTAVFAEQLPDALQLVIGSLRAGFSLPQALDGMIRESPEPVSAEFGRAMAEHRLGADIADALERVGQRTRSDDLSWAVMAVRIQREVGGKLAEVLQTTVDTMRERTRLRRHVKSLSAEGRLSGWVLVALPVVLGFAMFTFRRPYMQPLLVTTVGQLLLLVGLLLFILGTFWIIRVVKVDI